MLTNVANFSSGGGYRVKDNFLSLLDYKNVTFTFFPYFLLHPISGHNKNVIVNKQQCNTSMQFNVVFGDRRLIKEFISNKRSKIVPFI